MPYAALESVEVVADGHGEREQFLQPLLRFVKLEGDASGFEAHAGRQRFQLLINHGGGSFDQQLRLSHPLLPQVPDQPGHFVPALDFISGFVPFGDVLQPGDQRVAIREPFVPTRLTTQGARICWARRRLTPRRNSTVARST